MATLELTADNFNDVLEQNPIVFIDFWAAWCAPCRSFAPTYEAASDENPDIVFGKIDTEAQQELAATFQIRSIPTIAVIREGIMVFRESGALGDRRAAEAAGLKPAAAGGTLPAANKETAAPEHVRAAVFNVLPLPVFSRGSGCRRVRCWGSVPPGCGARTRLRTSARRPPAAPAGAPGGFGAAFRD